MDKSRRNFVSLGGAGLVAATVSGPLGLPQTQASGIEETKTPEAAGDAPVRPPQQVRTLNGWTLPHRWRNGVKEFHLIAEEIEHEFAPGTKVKCWGYNGSTPGPTIEAVEGDRVRILVTNGLKEHTSVHWHGILLPSGMDGVSGLNQPAIKPGETFAYEFTLKQHGTYMYHPHADEMTQMAVGMMGMFIIHPRERGGQTRRSGLLLLVAQLGRAPWHLSPGSSGHGGVRLVDI